MSEHQGVRCLAESVATEPLSPPSVWPCLTCIVHGSQKRNSTFRSHLLLVVGKMGSAKYRGSGQGQRDPLMESPWDRSGAHSHLTP
jgi:hypothetical protein